MTVLVELAQATHGSKHGPLIASQMMDVTIRVESIRTFAVKQMSLLLQVCCYSPLPIIVANIQN